MDQYPLRKMRIKFPTGTGFRKIQGTDTKKMRYQYKTRYRIQKNPRYRHKNEIPRQNEGTVMIPHKENAILSE
jgi:hypothetical protein